MARKAQDSASALAALLATDRVELATEFLAYSFTAILDDAFPRRAESELGGMFAEFAQVRLNKWLWRPTQEPDATVFRLLLEVVLLWERADLAARARSEPVEVALLMPGEALLRAEDPRAAVRSALRSVRR
ncbi:hypothetical protein OOK41_01035 [Micromonospora sp. NBC_01655]|uniref:hypothetical protein n=1 Tax=Micromonospora sp. NBC_01655 TaxID=2975983 RepID=UPI00224CE4DA|nr:hypothetical protein [Micromonospora sp. NBC_01655]MCX4468911.1 hypothetical protein [Micromonospora sp. NBC_01655]